MNCLFLRRPSALQNRFIGEIMKSFFKSSLAVAIVAAALAVAAVANQGGGAGSISGTVLDSTGAVVANATVEIHNPITGFERTATSDDKGNFTFLNVPFNHYHMTVTAQGFAQRAQDVEVRSTVATNVQASSENNRG